MLTYAFTTTTTKNTSMTGITSFFQTLTSNYRVLIFFLAIGGSLSLSAQIERPTFSAAGGSALNRSLCLTYTIGEPVIDGVFDPRLDLGYQQNSEYDLWSASFPLVLGPAQDSDGDGAVNLLEYALGTNPILSSSVAQPTIALTGPGELTLTANKNPNAANLYYSGQFSTDLQTWFSATVIAESTSLYAARIALPGVPSLFMRLNIQTLGDK
jgi:hypothetical protein